MYNFLGAGRAEEYGPELAEVSVMRNATVFQRFHYIALPIIRLMLGSGA